MGLVIFFFASSFSSSTVLFLMSISVYVKLVTYAMISKTLTIPTKTSLVDRVRSFLKFSTKLFSCSFLYTGKLRILCSFNIFKHVAMVAVSGTAIMCFFPLTNSPSVVSVMKL
eukprot:Lithocolla_globosa_v1_NODE_2842_length_1851_cov_25.532294.p2 type:complete len:113 gc:universal NODE_2842_length_1851_cov_25.532294:1198-1536(+)